MHDINSTIVGLQKQILSLDAAAEPDRKHAGAVIKKALDICKQLLLAPKSNKNLDFFFLSIAQTLHELLNLSQNTEIDSAHLAILRTAIQTLAGNYQESVVPMLTRLHNLSHDEDDMQTITTITSLGNEVITCCSQVYHFSDQLAPLECLFALTGLALMLAGIGLTIALLSRPATRHPLLQALSIVALGCSVCSKAVVRHRADPGADLVVASIGKIAPLIPEIARQNHSDQAKLIAVLNDEAVESFAEVIEPATVSKPTAAPRPTHKTTRAVKKEPAKKTRVKTTTHPKHDATVIEESVIIEETIVTAEPEPTPPKAHKPHNKANAETGPIKLMQRLKKFVNSLNEKRN